MRPIGLVYRILSDGSGIQWLVGGINNGNDIAVKDHADEADFHSSSVIIVESFSFLL